MTNLIIILIIPLVQFGVNINRLARPFGI